MDKNNILIEFVGLPGSGKTTIQRYFKQKYSDIANFKTNFVDRAGDPVNSVKTYRVIYFSIRNPRLVIQLIKFWGKSTNIHLNSLPQLVRCIKLAIKVDDWKNIQNSDILIINQGLIQFMGSLAIPARSTEVQDVEGLLSQLIYTRVDGFIHISCDFELAAARRRDRKHGKSRFEGALNSEQQADLERFQEVLIKSIEKSREYGIPQMDLDASDSLDVNSQKVMKFIESF